MIAIRLRRQVMKTITIRGIDPELDRFIKLNADENKLSINQWILQTLKNTMGIGKKNLFKQYHDLDHLAGGWGKQEQENFLKNAKNFEKIDKEIWQ
jgi:hypothetical protein